MFNAIRNIGTGIMYVGIFGVGAMLIVGTVSLDIVILAFLAKESRNNRGNAFITGYLWGSLFNRPDPYYYSSSRYGYYQAPLPDMTVLLIASPIITIIAIAASFALGVPGVGVGLFLGWAAALSTIGVGYAIHQLGNGLESTWRYLNTPSPKNNGSDNTSGVNPDNGRTFDFGENPAPKGNSFNKSYAGTSANQDYTRPTQNYNPTHFSQNASAPPMAQVVNASHDKYDSTIPEAPAYRVN